MISPFLVLQSALQSALQSVLQSVYRVSYKVFYRVSFPAETEETAADVRSDRLKPGVYREYIMMTIRENRTGAALMLLEPIILPGPGSCAGCPEYPGHLLR